MARIVCPHCGGPNDLSTRHAGWTVRCGHCGRTMQAPSDVSDEVGAETSAEPPPDLLEPRQTSRYLQTSPLAIASLVCGILTVPGTCIGGCCCSPVAIAAITCGIIAITQINNPRYEQQGMGLAIAGLVLGTIGVIGMFLPLTCLGLPQLLQDGQFDFNVNIGQTHHIKDASKLNRIHFAMTSYSEDHGGDWPGHVAEVVDSGHLSANALTASKNEPAAPPPPITGPAENATYQYGDIVFAYPGLPPPADVRPDAIIAFTADGQTTPGKRVVLHADGHLRTVSASEFDRLIEEENEARSKSGTAPPIAVPTP